MLLHNEYSFKPNFHQGLNLFRIKQYNPYGKPKLSAVVEFETEIVDYWNRISVTPDKKIEFGLRLINDHYEPFTTDYEIFDTNGNFIKQGRDSIIECSDLKKGLYYLNYDNQTGEVFIIK